MKSNKYNDLERNSDVWIDDWFLFYFISPLLRERQRKKAVQNQRMSIENGKQLLFRTVKMNIKWFLLHQILWDLQIGQILMFFENVWVAVNWRKGRRRRKKRKQRPLCNNWSAKIGSVKICGAGEMVIFVGAQWILCTLFTEINMECNFCSIKFEIRHICAQQYTTKWSISIQFLQHYSLIGFAFDVFFVSKCREKREKKNSSCTYSNTLVCNIDTFTFSSRTIFFLFIPFIRPIKWPIKCLERNVTSINFSRNENYFFFFENANIRTNPKIA